MKMNFKLIFFITVQFLHFVCGVPSFRRDVKNFESNSIFEPATVFEAPPVLNMQMLPPLEPVKRAVRVYTNGLPISNLNPDDDYANDKRSAGNYIHYDLEAPVETSKRLQPPPVLQMRILPPEGPNIYNNGQKTEAIYDKDSEELQNLDSPKSEHIVEPAESLSLAEWENYNIREPNGPGTYAWGYDIEDPLTGNVQFRSEEKHANGTVTGSYGYLEPDGLVRISHYVADAFGYRVTHETGKYKILPANTEPSAEFAVALESQQNLQQLGPNYSVQDQYLRPINNPKYSGKYNYYFIPT